MSVEQWLPVPGYEDSYEVSSLGRVRSLYRKGNTGRVLRPKTSKYGYQWVNLSQRGISQMRTVHSLVAEAFIGQRPAGLQVRHLDGESANNHINNLVYGTPSDNMYDRVRHGGNHNAAKTHCPKGHPYDEGNTIHRNDGGRACRECTRTRQREYARLRRQRTHSIPAPTIGDSGVSVSRTFT